MTTLGSRVNQLIAPNALVTGASGFVGSVLANRLLKMGWRVTLLVRHGSSVDQFLDRSCTIVSFDGSMSDAQLITIFKDIDVVFHCAGLTGVGHKKEDYFQANAELTDRILQASERACVSKFIFLSSILVYKFDGATSRFSEESKSALDVIDPYSLSKIRAESLCKKIREKSGLCTVIIRPAFIYGPGDRDGGFVPEMIRLIRINKFKFIGDGRNSIPLIYIQDLVDLIMLAADSDDSSGMIFNACSTEKVTWLQFIGSICDGLKLPLPSNIDARLILFMSAIFDYFLRIGWMSRVLLTSQSAHLMSGDYSFSADKAREILGFEAKVPFNEGVEKTLSSLK